MVVRELDRRSNSLPMPFVDVRVPWQLAAYRYIPVEEGGVRRRQTVPWRSGGLLHSTHRGAAPVDRVPPLATRDRPPYRIWRNVDQIGSGSRPACKNCHRRRCGAPMTASCGPMQLQLLMLQKLALLWRDMYRIKHVVKMPLLTHRYLSCQSTVTGVSNETNNSARNNGLTE